MNVVYHLKSSDRLRQKKDPDIDQATTKSDFGMVKCNVTHLVSVVYVTWGVCVLHFAGNYNCIFAMHEVRSGVCVLHFAGNYNTMDGADLWILGVCVLHFVGNYNDAFRAFTEYFDVSVLHLCVNTIW